MKEMDSCISNIFLNEDQDVFIQLFNLILNESVNGMACMISNVSTHCSACNITAPF